MTMIRDHGRLVAVLAILILAGLMAFGLWHVIVGGLLHNNARAATFGAVLATAAGGLLGAGFVVARRLPRA
ncbi:MAG TPA: hypothetical protein VIM20_05580 [Candidatus Limnocylindrales bacterium]